MTARDLSIIGAGHVGLVYAAAMAELGHRVACIDIDVDRIERIRRGELPIFEPGLDEAVSRHVKTSRLRFSTSYEDGLADAEFIFIAVSTPSTPDGAADLRAVRAAARGIAAAAGGRRPIIINKSTVPVGTGDSVDHILATADGRRPFKVVSNPEFLREGTALHDFFHPDRIVLGSRDRAAAERVAALYEGVNAPVLITDVKTAEMIKYASNAFLATKISFINEIAEICEAVGADAAQVAAGMGLDARIGGHFLRHGIGFGGSCLPKDVRALAYMGSVFGTHPQLLNAVLQINAAQRRRVLQKVRTALGQLDGARICILGLAFKPNTDDVRDAPAIDLIRLFLNEGADVTAYDPQAMTKTAAICPDAAYFPSPYDAAAGCDAIIVATEWPEFQDLDLARLRAATARPVFVDGRGFLDRDAIEEVGFTLISGRDDVSSVPVSTRDRNGHAVGVSA
ncbi:MAG: UDP-glucose/GDP-mannose dehydrogenase family protein [Chloroflexota bacterium]|nr:UDP-glucose/GDP-mannose dehydrogenase family protein [Chloroflexota bacterium]